MVSWQEVIPRTNQAAVSTAHLMAVPEMARNTTLVKSLPTAMAKIVRSFLVAMPSFAVHS